jgi:hypothetical protein
MNNKGTSGVESRGSWMVHSFGHEMKRIVRRVRSHAIHAQSRVGAHRCGMHPLLTLKELASKSHVRICDPSCSLDILESILKAATISPHQIGND